MLTSSPVDCDNKTSYNLSLPFAFNELAYLKLPFYSHLFFNLEILKEYENLQLAKIEHRPIVYFITILEKGHLSVRDCGFRVRWLIKHKKKLCTCLIATSVAFESILSIWFMQRFVFTNMYFKQLKSIIYPIDKNQ